MVELKPKIALDMDEVLVQCYGPLNDYRNANHLKPGERKLTLEDYTRYELETVWGCNKKESGKIVWDFYKKGHLRTLLPVPGSKQGVPKLSAFSRPEVITSRPDETSEDTHLSARNHFSGHIGKIHYANTHVEGKKVKKSDLANEHGIVLVVEDCYGHAYDFVQNGMAAILLRYPWNLYISDEQLRDEGITPVEGWLQIPETAKKILSQRGSNRFIFIP